MLHIVLDGIKEARAICISISDFSIFNYTMFKASYQYIPNHYRSSFVIIENTIVYKSKLVVQLNINQEITRVKTSYMITVIKHCKIKQRINIL